MPVLLVTRSADGDSVGGPALVGNLRAVPMAWVREREEGGGGKYTSQDCFSPSLQPGSSVDGNNVISIVRLSCRMTVAHLSAVPNVKTTSRLRAAALEWVFHLSTAGATWPRAASSRERTLPTSDVGSASHAKKEWTARRLQQLKWS